MPFGMATMSKVLWIVLGSFFGLILVAVIGIAILIPIVGKKFADQVRDPSAQRATAAKVAQFTVPRGYRILVATDLGISQSVIIASRRRHHGSMVIQLSAQHIPSDTKVQLDTLVSSQSMIAKFRGCDGQQKPDETIDRPGTSPAVLRVIGCGDAGDYEIGVLETKASTVSLSASGVRAGREHDAFVKFVGSIR